MISYPFSLVIGLFNQISPILQSVGELLFYYIFFIILAYIRKSRNRENENYYKNNIIQNKFVLSNEFIKCILENKRALIIDTLAAWTLYIISILTLLSDWVFGFLNETKTITSITHIVILLTIPVINIFIMLFIRKKWHKEYLKLHEKDKKQLFTATK